MEALLEAIEAFMAREVEHLDEDEAEQLGDRLQAALETVEDGPKRDALTAIAARHHWNAVTGGPLLWQPWAGFP